MAATYSATNLLATASLEVWSGINPARPTSPTQLAYHVPAFPPAHVADGRAGTVCRFSAVGSGTIGAMLQTAQPMNLVALINHNLRDTATVTLHFGNTPVGPWESLPLSVYEGAFYQVFPTTTRRYARLSVSGSTVDGKPFTLGQWWLGTSAALPPFVWGLEEGTDVIDSFSESEFGAPHAHYLAQRRVLRGSFAPALERATVEDLEMFRRHVQGRVRSFLLMPDPLRRQYVMLGRFTAPTWRRTAVPVATAGVADTRIRYSGVEFQFTEDPFGATGA